MILDRIKDIFNILINLDKSVGFKNVCKYVFLGLFILLLLNFKLVATEVVSFVMEIQEEIHSERMTLRDEYMTELTPLLVELRVTAGADRVLYFEFHNSEENLGGVPFKFFDLVKCNSNFEAEQVYGEAYKNVNTGMYSEFFDDLRKKGHLGCHGDEDISFRKKYLGVHEHLRVTDESAKHLFISLSGIKMPIGFIVLEWMNPKEGLEVSYDDRIVDEINKLSIYYATKRR